MAGNLPPLKALRAFDAAARQGSFARAADELHVTAAAVSHQVRRLEAYLDVALFRRTEAGLELTPAGRAMRADVAAGFGALARAVDRLGDSGARRTLRISVAPSLAARWLMARLDRFTSANPALELSIDARDERIDLHREDIDIALRYDGGARDELHAEPMGGHRIFPVCSPELIEGRARPLAPQDLFDLPLLHVEWRHATATGPADWSDWFARIGLQPPAGVRAGRRFGQHSMALDAAAAGQGVALANDLLAVDDEAAGRLVRPVAARVDDARGYRLLCLPAAAERARVRAFRRWLRDELAA